MAKGMHEWMRRNYYEATGVHPGAGVVQDLVDEVTKGNPQSKVQVDRINAIKQRLMEEAKTGTMGGNRRDMREIYKATEK